MYTLCTGKEKKISIWQIFAPVDVLPFRDTVISLHTTEDETL